MDSKKSRTGHWAGAIMKETEKQTYRKRNKEKKDSERDRKVMHQTTQSQTIPKARIYDFSLTARTAFTERSFCSESL